MRTLVVTELTKVSGGSHHNNNSHRNNNHHNNNHNHNNNHHNNHNQQVQQPPHNDPADGIAKLHIIESGLSNGDSWATIGKNIGAYFADKYGMVDHFGR